MHSGSEHILRTSAVMTDKDFTERKVLREIFSTANFYICLFHVLRTFKREITPQKMSVTPALRIAILEELQSICYPRTNEEHSQLLQSIQDMECPLVMVYFMKNWCPIGHEWVSGLQGSLTLDNRTNNRVESINQKSSVNCFKIRKSASAFQ